MNMKLKNIKSDVWFAGVDTTAKEILSQSSNEKDEQDSLLEIMMTYIHLYIIYRS